MAKLQTVDTMIDVARPSLDFNRSSTADISTELSKATKVLRETFAPKGSSAGDVLSQINYIIDDNLNKYKNGEISSVEFEDNINSQKIKALSDSKLAPEDWTKVTGQINDRMKNLTESYHFSVKDRQMVVDSFGNVTTLYNPAVSKDQQDLDALEVAYGTSGKAVVRYLLSIEDEAQRKAEIDRRIKQISRFAGNSLALQMLQVDRNAFEIEQKYSKEEAMAEINDEISDMTGVAERYFNDAEKDPVKAFNDFKLDMIAQFDNLSNVQEIARTRGLNLGDIKNNFLTQVNNYKELFDARAGLRKGTLEVDQLETQIKLQNLILEGKIKPEDRYLIENPNAIMSLTMAKRFSKHIGNDVASILNLERVSEAENKRLDKYLDKKDYNSILNYIEDGVDATNESEGIRSTVNPYILQQYYHSILGSPEMLDSDQLQRFNDLQSKWDMLMRLDKSFNKVMTMGKKYIEGKK